MKIIMLKGPDNSGKTTTLNLVYDELVKRNAAVKFKVELGWKGDDFASILNYNNKTVAIFSMGDYVDDIKRAIEYFDHKSVDILIIANRDKPQFDNLRLNGHIFITKKKLSKQKSQQTQTNQDDISCMNQIIANI